MVLAVITLARLTSSRRAALPSSLTTQIYNRLCDEAARQTDGSSTIVSCDPRDWPGGVIGQATRFNLEQLLLDEDYTKAGLDIPLSRRVSPPQHAPAKSDARTVIKIEDDDQPPKATTSASWPPAAQTSTHSSLADRLAHPRPHQKEHKTAAKEHRYPCWDCYARGNKCEIHPDSPSCVNCMTKKQPCNADDFEPKPVKKSYAVHAVYRALMAESRQRNSNHWAPVPPDPNRWHYHGCRGIVEHAYIFGLEERLQFADWRAAGFYNGPPPMQSPVYERLQQLPLQRRTKSTREERRGLSRRETARATPTPTAAPAFSIRGTARDNGWENTTRREARDAREATFKTPEVEPRLNVGDEGGSSRLDQQSTHSHRATSYGDHKKASSILLPKPMDTTLGAQAYVPARRPSQAPSPESMRGASSSRRTLDSGNEHCSTSNKRARYSVEAESVSNSTVAAAAAAAAAAADPPPPNAAPPSAATTTSTPQPSHRLMEYLPLFASEISVGDPARRARDMELAIRFLQEEVPLVLAWHDAQAAFSRKPFLDNWKEIIEEGLKRKRGSE